MVVRIEPAVIGMAEAVKFSDLDHQSKVAACDTGSSVIAVTSTERSYPLSKPVLVTLRGQPDERQLPVLLSAQREKKLLPSGGTAPSRHKEAD